MSNMQTKARRIWLVCFTSTDLRRYYGGDTKRVIAETMEAAMDLIKSEYPSATFVSINHHGIIDHE